MTVGVVVIEDLIFGAEDAFAVFGEAVFDAAVSFFGDLPFPLKFEVAVFFGGVNTASFVFSVQNACFGNPSSFFDCFAVCVGPTCEGFAVKDVGEVFIGETWRDEREEGE